jgi:hypothetical protein
LKARSSSPLWNGLVVHHKDVFVSHVISKLNTTDRCFFKKVYRESRVVLKYAGVNFVSGVRANVYECLRMYVHFDVGMDVESHALGNENLKVEE